MNLQEPARTQEPPVSSSGDGGPSAEQASESGAFSRPNPWADLYRDLAALRMYVSHYLAARSDKFKARVRVALIRGALGLVAAAVAATALIVAIVLLGLGVAHGLAVLLGSVWAGELLAGGGFLIVMAVGVWAGLGFLRIRSQNRIRRKYERRREQERRLTGRDVAG